MAELAEIRIFSSVFTKTSSTPGTFDQTSLTGFGYEKTRIEYAKWKKEWHDLIQSLLSSLYLRHDVLEIPLQN